MTAPGGSGESRVELRAACDGVLLRVRAKPGASRDAVEGVHGGALRVAVTAAPEKGKANEALAKVIAKVLGYRRSQVRIHSGETSRDKWFLISGVTAFDVSGRLDEAL